jgi:hypothetical protein
MKLLKDYLPSLDITKITPNMMSSIGRPGKPSPSVSAKKSRSSPIKPCKGEIAVNTQTGSKKVLQSSSILTQHTNTPIYITQWIQIGSSKCLCFFDTGANIHMIDGKMAEKEGLKVISQVPTILKVVGGSDLVTDYGKYKLNLGPTPDQKFQELTCHGMSHIAGPFPRFNLKEVNSEVRSHQTVSAEEKLPKYVAGSVVHLLIGIGESAAQPIHIATLPSGISVYRSPFTDIFGSNICYGGSHDSFKGSSVLSGTNHAVLLINTLNVVKESMLISPKDTVKANESDLLPLSVYDSDVEEIGNEISTDIFPNPLTQKGFEDEMCSVEVKNFVPEPEMDQIDQGHGSCQSIHWPGLTKAVNLQESMEQEIIEKPVTMDKEEKKVFDYLLLLEDTVSPLTEQHNAPNYLKSAKQVHVQQCRNPDIHRQEMRKAQVESVERGLMIKISDLDSQARRQKGTRLSRMDYWSSDVSKMCYQLQLNEAPYLPESCILVPNVPGIWGFMDKIAKEGVVKAVVGILLLMRYSDTGCMDRFLKNFHAQSLVNSLIPASYFNKASMKKWDEPQVVLDWMLLQDAHVWLFFEADSRSSMMVKLYPPKYEIFSFLYLRISTKESSKVLVTEKVIKVDNHHP